MAPRRARLDKEEALERISEKTGTRKLVWFGDIGEDSRGLLDLPQYSHCYCGVAAPESDRLQVLSLENLLGKRPVDGEMPPLMGPLGKQVFAWLKSAVSEPCLVMSRTPISIMPMIQAMSPQIEYIGNSYEMYRALSDKVAVEAALSDVPGLKMIPYEQVANDASRPRVLRRRLADGPIVLRRSGLSAGIGHELIRDEQALSTSVFAGIEETVSVGPYLQDFYTVGVGACVFPDGGITQHSPLTVLAGHPLFGPHDFSWGGNDFGIAAKLSTDALETVEAAVHSVGTWLHGQRKSATTWRPTLGSAGSRGSALSWTTHWANPASFWTISWHGSASSHTKQSPSRNRRLFSHLTHTSCAATGPVNAYD
jgi:hypothetical protein